MRFFFILITLFLVGCSPPEEPPELDIYYSSFEQVRSGSKVEDILSGAADYESHKYITKISNLSKTAIIYCKSGERQSKGVSWDYGNQAVRFTDSRDGTIGGAFPNRVQTRSYLPYCEEITTDVGFEIALEKLKTMAKAFENCGDINTQTQKLIDSWNSCMNKILY